MQITVKLKLKEPIDIAVFQRKYNNVAHWAYNRALEGMGKFDIFGMLGNLNNVDELDLSWKREAVKDGYGKAKATLARAKAKDEEGNKAAEEMKPSIFGGRGLFYRRLRGKITRERFLKERKMFPITCEGSKADSRGNRKFKFDFNTFTGTVMLNDGRIPFSCHPTSRANMRLLMALQERIERKECGMTCRITPTDFYLVFEVDSLDAEKAYRPDRDVTMAVDMNPNYIGMSIVDGKSVLLRRAYDLSKVRGSDKKKYELTQVVLDLKRLCREYKVSAVGYEELVMPASDKGKGRRFNRQVNNEWCRDYFVNSLRKHLALAGCRCFEIAPQYSSFIGCMMYPEETDSIAASLELNRRLRTYISMFIERTEPRGPVIWPKYSEEFLNRWKEEGAPQSGFGGWMSAYQWAKKSKLSYRLLYPVFVKRSQAAVSRLKSWRSRVTFVNLDNKIPYLG